MIVTPGQLSRRGQFYHQLAQLTNAGITLTNALEQISRHPPSPSYRGPLHNVLVELAAGKTLSNSLRGADWLPEFDLTLISAGERSGRLDQCFHSLADYYNQRALVARQIISQMIYPVFLIHFAALIFLVVLPFASSQFNASLSWLFVKTAFALSPIYIVTALVVFVSQNKRGEHWRAVMEQIYNSIPVLASARRSLALSRLTLALEALISAGVNIVEAWELAAIASNSPMLCRVVAGWKDHFADGRTPSELVSAVSIFPATFANLYHSGEISGKLDDTLKRLHAFYQEDSSYKINLLAQWIPRAIYIVTVLVIAWKIIEFWSGYYNNVSKVVGGF